VAQLRGSGRHRAGGPQLPQVQPARHHDDRCHSGLPDAHAQPLRHHRPDSQVGIPAGNIKKKILANPFAREALEKNPKLKPRILTITQSTYDGMLYNVEEIKGMLDGEVDTLHFDEAWLPHASFHDFYGDFHAIGEGRPRCRTA
jgi:arginine/lysine/ornithine decarboxylase